MSDTIICTLVVMAVLVLLSMVVSVWYSIIGTKQERRNAKLKLKIEEIKLRNQILELEGRKDERTRK